MKSIQFQQAAIKVKQAITFNSPYVHLNIALKPGGGLKYHARTKLSQT